MCIRDSTGAANAWSVIAADPARGMVFIPTGSASPDYFGGERLGDNLYANSVVALRADSGQMIWHFQTVHHDLWDYDAVSYTHLHGELITVHLNRPEWSPEQRQMVQEGLAGARTRGAEVVELDGEDAVDTVLRFARQRGITQIYVGHRRRDSWWERAFGSDLDRLIRAAEGIDVRVFPHH